MSEEKKNVEGTPEDATTENTSVVVPPVESEDSSESTESDEGATEVEFVPAHVTEGGRDYRVEGNDVSGYIGVDPEYMTYANETEKPLLTHTERYDYTNQYDHLEGNADEDAGEPEVEVESGEGDGFKAEEVDEDPEAVEPKDAESKEDENEKKDETFISPNLV